MGTRVRRRKRRRRRNAALAVLFFVLFLAVAAMITHCVFLLHGHSVLSKSYYYNKESNIVMGDIVSIKVENPKVLLVNKEHELPADYVPENLVMPEVEFAANAAEERRYMDKTAAEALEDLFAAAKEDGVELIGVSGYRSYNTQSGIYYHNLRRNGYGYTSIYSAQPGKSEHQTGLAIDVSCEEIGCQLYSRFAQTKEGIWLREHCEEYGFIIRYAENKTDITGYAYEPWHIRYVGVKVAQYLKLHDITLDEYGKAMGYEEYYDIPSALAEELTY